jgi:hypothetical protein
LLRKMKLKLNRWLAKSPAHTNQFFSDLTGPEIEEKKTFSPRLTDPPCI